MMLDEELRTVVDGIKGLYVQMMHHVNFFNITRLVYSINF